jgi:type IV secretory pathway TrbD component
MGAEREIALSISLIAMLVGIGGMTWLAGFVAILFYVVGIVVARRMAKADPIMSKVWMRHIKQQLYYPAKSGIWRQ